MKNIENYTSNTNPFSTDLSDFSTIFINSISANSNSTQNYFN